MMAHDRLGGRQRPSLMASFLLSLLLLRAACAKDIFVAGSDRQLGDDFRWLDGRSVPDSQQEPLPQPPQITAAPSVAELEFSLQVHRDALARRQDPAQQFQEASRQLQQSFQSASQSLQQSFQQATQSIRQQLQSQVQSAQQSGQQAAESARQSAESVKQSLNQQLQSVSQSSRQAVESLSRALEEASRSADNRVRELSSSLLASASSALRAAAAAKPTADGDGGSITQGNGRNGGGNFGSGNMLAGQSRGNDNGNNGGTVTGGGSDSGGSSGLPVSGVVGAVVGAILASSLLSVLGFFLVTRYQRRRRQARYGGGRWGANSPTGGEYLRGGGISYPKSNDGASSYFGVDEKDPRYMMTPRTPAPVRFGGDAGYDAERASGFGERERGRQLRRSSYDEAFGSEARSTMAFSTSNPTTATPTAAGHTSLYAPPPRKEAANALPRIDTSRAAAGATATVTNVAHKNSDSNGSNSSNGIGARFSLFPIRTRFGVGGLTRKGNNSNDDGLRRKSSSVLGNVAAIDAATARATAGRGSGGQQRLSTMRESPSPTQFQTWLRTTTGTVSPFGRLSIGAASSGSNSNNNTGGNGNSNGSMAAPNGPLNSNQITTTTTRRPGVGTGIAGVNRKISTASKASSISSAYSTDSDGYRNDGQLGTPGVAR